MAEESASPAAPTAPSHAITLVPFSEALEIYCRQHPRKEIRKLPASEWMKSRVGSAHGNVPSPEDVRSSFTTASPALIKITRDRAAQDSMAEGLTRWLMATLPDVPPQLAGEREVFCNREWRLLKYPAGGFFAPHTDSISGPEHIATMIFIPPLSYSAHTGGTLRIYPSEGAIPAEGVIPSPPTEINAHPEMGTLVVLPLGRMHEVTPVTSGVRYALTSPLLLPRGMVEIMNAELYSEPLPIDVRDEGRDSQETSIGGLQRRIDTLTRLLDVLKGEMATLRADPTTTPTLEVIRRRTPRLPIAVALTQFYRGRNVADSLSTEDRVTFNGLLALYPGASIRLVNAPCNARNDLFEADATFKPSRWEGLFECGGRWEEVQVDDEAMAAVGDSMCELPFFYGGRDPPGDEESEESVYNDEGYDKITNLSVTLAIVHRRGGI